MRRTIGLVVAVAAVALVVAVAAYGAPKQGPSPGLTAYGRLVWNFEGVAAQTAGSAF